MSDAPLEVEVHLQPPPAPALRGTTAIVLDIFRATTVHAALFAGGAAAVWPAADFSHGATLAQSIADSRLIGEIGALPPPEAEYGNSPTEFASLDVRGWRVVHVTSNGTRALTHAASADAVYSGCLRNRSATLRHALAGAPQRVAVICSGDHGGASPSVEDAFAAGAYVSELQRLGVGASSPVSWRGGAGLALKLYHAYARSPARAFADSPHGERLRQLGFWADFAYAGAIDADQTVIALTADDLGRPVLERVPALPH